MKMAIKFYGFSNITQHNYFYPNYQNISFLHQFISIKTSLSPIPTHNQLFSFESSTAIADGDVKRQQQR